MYRSLWENKRMNLKIHKQNYLVDYSMFLVMTIKIDSHNYREDNYKGT